MRFAPLATGRGTRYRSGARLSRSFTFRSRTVDPLYSVIVPAYNAENYLSQSVRSVLEQTVPPLEVIVIDDGSVDDTVAIAAMFGPPVRVIHQDRRGAGAARNKGVAAATSPLVAFVDADDYWLPTKAERQLEQFEDPFVGLSHTYHRWVDQFGNTLREVNLPYEGWLFHDLLRECVIGILSVMCRRDLLIAAGGFRSDMSYAADWDCWLRLSRSTRVAVVKETLCCYRVHGSNMSSNDTGMLREALLALDAQRDSLVCPECWRSYRAGRERARQMYGTRMLHHPDERYPLLAIVAAWPALVATVAFWQVVARRILRRLGIWHRLARSVRQRHASR
jgi:hypothetical protein